MGDRGNIYVKNNDTAGVYLYGHYSGYELSTTLRDVLRKKRRWDDDQYLARMIFCAMVGDDRGEPDGEGGWNYTQPGYINDASSISIHESSDGWMGTTGKFDDVQGADLTITHWSPKPVVEDECGSCHQLGGNHRQQCMNSLRRRIENDPARKEGAP